MVITRCSNNYGPYQYPEKLVPLFVTNAIEDEPLPVYGTGENTPRLDPRRGPLRGARHDARAPPGVEGEVFNIGAGNELDVLDDHGRDPRAARQARRR